MINEKIYYLHRGHLGDFWSYINWLIKNNDQDIYVYSKTKERYDFYNILFKLIETNKKFIYTDTITNLIKIGKNKKFVDIQYNNTIVNYFNTYEKENTICYNFTCSCYIKEKTPSNIINYLSHEKIKKYKLLEVNKPMNLSEIINNLSKCKLYIGLDHGISHVARSVGCPMILITNTHSFRAFPPKYCNYNGFNNIDDYNNYINTIL